MQHLPVTSFTWLFVNNQESADSQRYVFGRSPSRSPTPSSEKPDEEEGPSEEEAASLSLLQHHATAATIELSRARRSPLMIFSSEDSRLRVNARLNGVNEPHVNDRWCAPSSHSDPLGFPVPDFTINGTT